MVEGNYEKTTARVVVEEGASDEFEVKIVRRSRGDSGPMSHFSDYSPLHVCELS